MKLVLMIIPVLILPIAIYSTEVFDVEVCKRVEGCRLIFSSKTMKTYCPTCVKESIIINPLIRPKKVNKSTSSSSGKFNIIKWITTDYIEQVF